MKKLLILVTVVALGTASMAYAQQQSGIGSPEFQGQCQGMGQGMGMKGKRGKGMRGMCDVDNITVTTVEQAEAAAETFISANFKGYTVNDVKTFETRRGNTAYVAETTDAGGNNFNFMVSPCGLVKGPMKPRVQQ